MITPMTAEPRHSAPHLPPSAPRVHWATLLTGLVVGAAVALAIVFGVRDVSATIAPKVQVHGYLDLVNSSDGTTNASSVGTNCFGTGGYSDLAQGADVTISDNVGKTLAVVPLSAGTFRELPGSTTAYGCVFSFAATVPAGKATYGVAISHRGTVIFSPSQIGSAQLTIGGS